MLAQVELIKYSLVLTVLGSFMVSVQKFVVEIIDLCLLLLRSLVWRIISIGA